MAMTQAEYIAILLDDCGFETAAQRKDYLRIRYGVDFSDELSPSQAHTVIEDLKARKKRHAPEPEEAA